MQTINQIFSAVDTDNKIISQYQFMKHTGTTNVICNLLVSIIHIITFFKKHAHHNYCKHFCSEAA